MFKIGGEEILFKDWQKGGINFVNDLFHNVKNRFLYPNEISERYKVTF